MKRVATTLGGVRPPVVRASAARIAPDYSRSVLSTRSRVTGAGRVSGTGLVWDHLVALGNDMRRRLIVDL
jgi:hypothetical protein